MRSDQMLKSGQIEDLIAWVSALDRRELSSQFRKYRASFPVDFSNAFLGRESLEKLQHIFVAMCIEQRRMPDIPAAEAA
jgi:hypothetical protein